MKIYLTKEAELQAKVLELQAKIARLKSELAYHEAQSLDGDGQRCEECGAVRHVNDCVEIEGFYACSEECAECVRRDIAEELHEQARREAHFRTVYRS